MEIKNTEPSSLMAQSSVPAMNVENESIPKFICFLILLLPFFMFHWTIPFMGSVMVGGDYLLYAFRPQMELLFSIKTGSFPLYAPGFAGGQSSSALTLAQIFHPLPYFASMMPGYWEGKAIEWNNFIKLLSIGFAHLALFSFFKKIRLRSLFAFLFSLIAVYNLRVIDVYRYGAPLEAYTAFYFLCAAIGWYLTKPKGWIGPVCIIGATYLLVCSGHPQMSYFGLIGAVLFASVAPFFLSAMLPERQVEYKGIFRSWAVVYSSLCSGIILSSAYILPFYFDFVKTNINRIGQDYSWAISNLDSFAGTLNNFFLPLHSDAYSAFGGSSLTLLAVGLPLLRFSRFRIPPVIWSIWGLLLFMFLFIQGDRTPVHRIVWEYVPFASSVRVPGRLSMIMPFFIVLILAWSVKADLLSRNLKRISHTMDPAALLTYISLALMMICLVLYIAVYNMLPRTEFQKYFNPPLGQFLDVPFVWVSSIIMILGIASLVFFSLCTGRNHSRKAYGIILVILIVVQLGIAMKYRSAHWIIKKYDSPTFEAMLYQKKTSLDYPYYPGGGLHLSVAIIQINESFLEPFLGKIFTHVIPVDSPDEAYERMRHERLPHQIFIESYDADKATAITENSENMTTADVTLKYSSFNRLTFEVNSEYPALFGLSYPYTGYWRAWVDGDKVRIYRANGAAHAIEVPEGKSLVEFRYWSSANLWGMIISFASFTIIGLFFCIGALKGIPRILSIVLIFIISAGGFAIWYDSLYSGDNLNTEYSWVYTQPGTPNLAYGKKSWLSPKAVPKPFAHTRKEARISKLVDGNRSPGSGFTSLASDNPAWFLDLNNQRNINRILLFESSQDTSANTRPLTLAVSNDGNEWRTVASVVSPMNENGPWRIVFDRPENARFIKIEASGKTKLSLDEVEVYGPQDG